MDDADMTERGQGMVRTWRWGVVMIVAMVTTGAVVPRAVHGDIGISLGGDGSFASWVDPACHAPTTLRQPPSPAVPVKQRSVLRLAGTGAVTSPVFRVLGPYMQFTYSFETIPRGRLNGQVHFRMYRRADHGCLGFFVVPGVSGSAAQAYMSSYCDQGCYITLSSRHVRFLVEIGQPPYHVR